MIAAPARRAARMVPIAAAARAAQAAGRGDFGRHRLGTFGHEIVYRNASRIVPRQFDGNGSAGILSRARYQSHLSAKIKQVVTNHIESSGLQGR